MRIEAVVIELRTSVEEANVKRKEGKSINDCLECYWQCLAVLKSWNAAEE